MENGTDLFNHLLRLLPCGWEAKAKELGALKRARVIKTAGELLRMILLYVTEGKSFAGTSAIISLSGKLISKISVFNRFKKCAEWLKWLCEHIYRQEGLLVEKPQWLEGKNVCLVDASESGKCSKTQQVHFRLHYCIDLFTLCMREFSLTPIKEGEKLSNFKKFGKDDIVMADRGYTNIKGIEYIKKVQADYLLRMNAGVFNLYDAENQKIDLLKHLESLNLKEWETIDIFAHCIIDKKLYPVRICAIRKDEDKEKEGLERISKTNRRKNKGEKKRESELQKQNNKYILVITSLGKQVSAVQIMELYRARWQIEIAFKRLKSIFQYEEIPPRLSENIKTWFYGKLLLAALTETMVNIGRFSPGDEECSKEVLPAPAKQRSLWRELRIAYSMLIKLVLDILDCTNLSLVLKRLSNACRDSKRKRIPQLHSFNSA